MLVFETKRLDVSKSEITEEEIDALFSLWTNSDVTKNVGFPNGVPYTKEKIRERLEQRNVSIFHAEKIPMRLLVCVV